MLHARNNFLLSCCRDVVTIVKCFAFILPSFGLNMRGKITLIVIISYTQCKMYVLTELFTGQFADLQMSFGQRDAMNVFLYTRNKM